MTVFVQARWFTPTTGRQINLAVVHRMEAPDKPNTAEGTAAFFARLPATDKASAHACYDSDSVVLCVRDADVAYHAPGANHDGKGYELAGYSKDDDWHAPTIQSMLHRLAADVAADSAAYGFPLRWRTAEDLLAGGDGRKGVTSHAEVTRAYPNLGSHWDPGPVFPHDEFIAMCLGSTAKPVPAVDHYTFKPGEPDMPLAATAVIGAPLDARLCGFTEGFYELTADGGVKALGNAPFFGSYPGLPDDARKGERYATGLTPNEDGSKGYTVWTNDGGKYKFGPGLNGF